MRFNEICGSLLSLSWSLYPHHLGGNKGQPRLAWRERSQARGPSTGPCTAPSHSSSICQTSLTRSPIGTSRPSPCSSSSWSTLTSLPAVPTVTHGYWSPAPDRELPKVSACGPGAHNRARMEVGLELAGPPTASCQITRYEEEQGKASLPPGQEAI